MENKNELQILGEHIKRYIFVSLGFWYLFVIAIIIAFAFAKYKNRYARNLYSIYTTIYIQTGRTSSPEIYAGGIAIRAGLNLENEIGVLTSYQMNYDVLKQLPQFEISYYKDNKFAYDPELYKRCPFKITFDSASNQLYNKRIYVKILDTNRLEIFFNSKYKNGYIVRFGEFFTKDDIKFYIQKTENFTKSAIGQKYYFVHKKLDQLAHQYSQRLRIDRRSPNSTILWIWMETFVPLKDIDYLNKLADLYINRRLQKKNEIAIKIIEFIDKQLEIFSDSLQIAEEQMQQFKQKNIVDLTDKGKTINEQLKEIELQKKQLEINLAYYKQLYHSIQNNQDTTTFIPPSAIGINDPILQSYLQQYTQELFQQTIMQLSVKKPKAFPITYEQELKFAQIKNSLLNYIIKSIEYTQSSINQLEQKKKEIESRLSQLPIAERQFMHLSRKFDINNQIYTFLMERRMEAGITLASSRPDAEVIDRAVPETIRFKRKVGYINTTKTLMIAIFIVVLIISIIFIFDNKIKNKTDIELITDIPIIGTITHNKRKELLPVIKHPRSSIAESFRSLKTNLIYFMVSTEGNTILVTSTVSGEGKSFITSNLAALFAVSNKKTVILEADLRKPKIHKNFGIEKDIGISTYLIGEHTYEEIILPTSVKNLYIVPSGEIPPNPVELLESAKMQQLVKKLKQDFDYIILDSPPIGIVTDALVLANYADVFLFVVRQLFTTKQSIRLLNELRERNKLEHIAIVVNDIKTSLVYGLRYGYGYSYGYGYGYSYGYGYYEDEQEKAVFWIKRIGLKIRQIITNLIR